MRDLDLQVRPGEFLGIVGPSGCGKTTALRILAGIETPSAGAVVIGGQDVTGFPPEHRSVGVVFQNYALFPHLNVFENVAFGGRMRKEKGAGLGERVREMLKLVRMEEQAERFVFELSGGQQQRVAVARALAQRPQVLLLDEPFSNLDERLRDETREQVREIVQTLGVTTILVTHDREEAFSLCGRVAVMLEGQVEQIGTPQEIYFSPATANAATFWQDGNLLPVGKLGAQAWKGIQVPLSQPEYVFFRANAAAVQSGSEATGSSRIDAGLRISGTLLATRFGGALWWCRVETCAGPVTVSLPGNTAVPAVAAPCVIEVPQSRLAWVG
ncbi:MAG: ABC transporter ATP-binding protein [Blastocatellia bacterium]|nr:ABC transporter ATP-binding protein [Blastocatellia bacterium]